MGFGRGTRARLGRRKRQKPRKEQEGDELVLTFDEIGAIAGVPLDHSFLNYKKELLPHGWEVGKISMKQQTVRFKRLAE